jgi:hypothetical protein
MKYITIVKTILTLLPVLIDAIKAVEKAIQGSGKGAEKLALIRGILEQAYVIADDASIQFEQLWPSLEKLITNLVATFNALGWDNE